MRFASKNVRNKVKFPPYCRRMSFVYAAIQLRVTANKEDNLNSARGKILEASKQGAQVICLPECFTCPYGTQFFRQYSENAEDGPTQKMLSSIAQETSCYIVGGSFPEIDQDQIFNTCLIFDRKGKMIGKHRKIHLFDIDIPGKIKFIESETLTRGSSLTTVDTEFGKIGVGICYDMRFPELAHLYQQQGCVLICYPGAFNKTTGPAHWELLQRSRAIDNQLFVSAVSIARDTSAGYIAWGHSSVVNPWGEVISSAGEKEETIYSTIDTNKITEIRNQIPVLKQKRYDVYSQIEANKT